jgi:hypothetical protein
MKSNHPPNTVAGSKGKSATDFPAVADGIKTSLLVRQFENGRLICELPLPENAEHNASGAVWRTVSKWSPVAGRDGCFDLCATITLLAGEMPQSSVAVAAAIPHWDREAYVLMPGIVYAGNRFDIFPMDYPPLIREREKFRLDMPTHMTEQPHLNKDGSNGSINLETGYATTPAMGFCDSAGRGFLMLTQQRDAWGNLGLTVEEDNEKRVGKFLVSSPQAREQKLSWNSGEWRLRDWQAGDSATLKVRFCFFQADKIQTLFDRLAEWRKDLNSARRVHTIPFSAAARLVRDKWNATHWDDDLGFYFGDGNSPSQPNRWQLGWISGLIVTQPLFQQGDDLTRWRVMRDLAFVFEKTPAASGFFNGSSNGTEFFSDAFDQPHPHKMSMVRKQGDGLYYALRQLMLFRDLEVQIPAAWKRAVRGLADAFVKLFRQNGQVGQFVDVETGELLIGGSTAGGIVPAGLVLAAEYFKEPCYLDLAEKLGSFLVKEFVAKGLTTGGPGEALAAPDSESSYALLKSLITLYEATGKQTWADAARDMTRQFASWVVSYDYAFPPESPMARIQARSIGSVVANTQNKHSAPGICTHSGDDLFRLWRATGDEFALELIRDIAHGIPQYVSRADCPVDKLSPGEMCERVNLSDWEGMNNVGGRIFGSCAWPETAMLLTAAEIPGVYVRTDTGRVVVFDHIEAKYVNGDGPAKLVLKNPTRYDAEVSVLAEDRSDSEQPLGADLLRTAQVIAVAAGATVEVPLKPKNYTATKVLSAQLARA